MYLYLLMNYKIIIHLIILLLILKVGTSSLSKLRTFLPYDGNSRNVLYFCRPSTSNA
ncbi:hypothetical protein RDI58_017679 [Solanum bulbocastanum]|uniref:Uncharacterized protein n=1 Tax=Solanum bulbocastanum TaxID=147425 RepID=A0AAN8Y926_SOLBU